jgi:hypothetical protein
MSIRGYIKRGQYQIAREKIEDILGEGLNFDRDGREPQHPDISSVRLAGLAPEDFRKPEVVAEAADLWKRLGFDSPYWKRWGGNTKVVDSSGAPLKVWRGAGGKITFLDPSSKGGNTLAKSAKKAFWFTDNALNAQWYADRYVGKKSPYRRSRNVKEEFRREFQKIREQLNETKELYEKAHWTHQAILWARMERLDGKLRRMLEAEETSEPMESVVQGFYLNMENPLVVDLAGEAYSDSRWMELLTKAETEGYDGVIFKNTYDPMYGTMYAILEPEQAKLESNIGTFDPTDELHWDQDSPTQQSVRGVSKLMQNFWEKGKLRTLNTAAKAMDGIIQLQQLAAGQPDDYALQSFYKLTQLSLKMKNNLQVDAEETTKQMMRLNGASPETINTLKKVMEAEFKSDALRGMLVGVAQDGTVVWGGEAGTSRSR